MSNRWFVRFSIGVASLLLVMTSVRATGSAVAFQTPLKRAVSCVEAATPTAPPFATPRAQSSPAASPSPTGSELDPIYLDLMITQQQQVLDMARLGAVRSENRELQQLSERIIAGTEPLLDSLRSLRSNAFPESPRLSTTETMRELDEFSSSHLLKGGVPGAMVIVAGNNIINDLCFMAADFDQLYLDNLIEQFDAGIVLSQVAIDFAGNSLTSALAAEVVHADRPFEDAAIAVRSVIESGTPFASPVGGS